MDSASFTDPHCSLSLFSPSFVFLHISFSPKVCKSTYYLRTKVGTVHVVPVGVPTPPCYFLEGKLSRGRGGSGGGGGVLSMARRVQWPMPEHYPSARPGSRTEEVASSCTYREPPRRIKARPTGLRLQRSRRAATCSTWTMLYSSFFLSFTDCYCSPLLLNDRCPQVLYHGISSLLLDFWVPGM